MVWQRLGAAGQTNFKRLYESFFFTAAFFAGALVAADLVAADLVAADLAAVDLTAGLPARVATGLVTAVVLARCGRLLP